MTVLAFDTETTGLVQQGRPLSLQPHLVQLAALQYSPEGQLLNQISLIIRPDGWEIPEAAAKVHGITTERALAQGVPLRTALAIFGQMRKISTVAVAHNMKFDRVIIEAAVLRAFDGQTVLPPIEEACTLEMAGPIVNLPPTARMVASGFNKFKPPNLTECMRFFFNEDLEGAHDALVDVTGCARVYWKIKEIEAQKLLEADNGGA